MKRLKMGLMALAALSSVGGAFAFTPKAGKSSMTYYAVKDAAGWHFQTSKPSTSLYACQPASSGICTIVTNTTPTDNSLNGRSDQHELYQLIN